MWSMSTPLFALCLALCLSTGLSMESFKAADGYEVFPSVPGSRYKLYTIELKWSDALYVCQNDGGGAHLLIINSNEEANVAIELISRYPDDVSWVGINDIETEGEWVTVKGGPVSLSGFNKWKVGSPSSRREWNCAYIVSDGLYDDYSCSTKIPFICEKPNE